MPLVVLGVVFANQYIIGVLICIASIICMYEYFKVIKKISQPIEWLGYLSNIYIILAAFLQKADFFMIVFYSIPFIVLLLFLQIILSDMQITFKDMAYTLTTIFYIPFFLVFLELIRCMNNGKFLVGYTLIIAWSTDIFAYLVGRHFGKHKFSKVSPKKSVEGCVAGVIGAAITTFIYSFVMQYFIEINYSYEFFIIVGLILSIISQIGDFSASSIKRYVDEKDYGNLLPGHGGMLDRIDSLLFVAPFAYMIFSIF